MIELLVGELLLIGVTKDQLREKFSTFDLVRQIERYGILDFMTRMKHLFNGRVLDFGSGTQPYRHLVSGEYVPFEIVDTMSGLFDCIICNQVMQYIQNPICVLEQFRDHLKESGYLVMTYATNWDEVEETDYQRFTKSGMAHLLKNAGFEILHHERRSQIRFNNFKIPLGYGVVAKKVI